MQTNFEQRYKMGADPLLILERIQHLIQRAVAVEPRPDLIVWPETAYPYGYIAIDPADVPPRRWPSRSDGSTIRSRWPTGSRRRQRIDEHLHGLTDAIGAADARGLAVLRPSRRRLQPSTTRPSSSSP